MRWLGPAPIPFLACVPLLCAAACGSSNPSGHGGAAAGGGATSTAASTGASGHGASSASGSGTGGAGHGGATGSTGTAGATTSTSGSSTGGSTASMSGSSTGGATTSTSGSSTGGSTTSTSGSSTSGSTTSTSGSSTSGSTTSTSGSSTSGSTSSSSAGTGGAQCPGGCTSPPSGCYGSPGTCVGGVCSYPFVEGASCDDGNACTVADTCTAGSCVGTPMVCDAPPSSVCVSGSALLTYDTTGTCQSGLCVYAQHQITCSGGPCVKGACQTDPCQGVTCTTPPSSCYSAAGTCQAGSCSYPFANGVACDDGNACTANDTCNAGVCAGAPLACNTPPPNVCSNATTLEVYPPLGTCSAGTCGYAPSFVTCAAGCAGGMCSGSGWVTMTSSTNQNLWGVWGSSASAVWAVGEGGTADFYNGVQWEVQGPPTTVTVWSVHGTAANNVFAADASGHVFKWNGSSWALHVTVPVLYAGLFVDGVDSLWIGGQGGGVNTVLYRSVNGAAVLVGSVPQTEALDNNGAGVWASSPTDVWVSLWGGYLAHYNGGLAKQSIGANPVWGASANQVFIGDFESLYEWTGAGFSLINVGLAGYINGLSGTSGARVFGAMQLDAGGGAVFLYDGSGVTQQAIPAKTPQLNAIWAAPTGEVFAVGSAGTIIKGP